MKRPNRKKEADEALSCGLVKFHSEQPCLKDGTTVFYSRNAECVECRRLTGAKKVAGHGSKKGMTLRKIADLANKKTFFGKACECGCTEKFTKCGQCVACSRARKAKPKQEGVKPSLFDMASRAFLRG